MGDHASGFVPAAVFIDFLKLGSNAIHVDGLGPGPTTGTNSTDGLFHLSENEVGLRMLGRQRKTVGIAVPQSKAGSIGLAVVPALPLFSGRMAHRALGPSQSVWLGGMPRFGPNLQPADFLQFLTSGERKQSTPCIFGSKTYFRMALGRRALFD